MKTTKYDQLTVHTFPTEAELAQAAAKEAQKCLSAAIAQNGSAAAILASANSQIRFLEAVVALGGVDWSRVTLFHMDEYLGISADHPASFRKYMREKVEALLKPKVFHYVPGDAPQPIAACEAYEALLKAQPIDLCCLGIGENGHIAFNDPPVADFNDARGVKIVELDRACRLQQVNEGHFPNYDAVPAYAVTLTVPMLCSAKRMLCIVPETRKAQAVKDTLEGPVATACPASILRTKPQATLYLDSDSASLLA